MDKDFYFKIEGIEEINKMLNDLPKFVNDKVQADLNKAGANIVKAELKANSPEGNNDKKQKEKIGDNVIVKKSPSKTGYFIGFTKNVFYVKFLELGTSVRQTLGKGKYKRGANRGVMIRKPFIEKTHQEAASKVVDFLRENYLNIINKTLKRLAKKYK